MHHNLQSPPRALSAGIGYANAEEIDTLIDLGQRMHDESAYAFLPYDRRKVRRLFEDYLADPANFCVLVVRSENVAVGMLMGYISEYDFCDETIASDTVLYVLPQHRSWRAAAGLVRGFREWAALRGARELCLGISSNVSVARTTKLYERLGLTYVGGTFKERLS